MDFLEESWDTIKDKWFVFAGEGLVVGIFLLFMNSLNNFNDEIAFMANNFDDKISQSFSVMSHGNGSAWGFFFMAIFLTLLFVGIIVLSFMQASDSYNPIFMIVASFLLLILNIFLVSKIWSTISIPILGSVITVIIVVAILIFAVAQYSK